MRIFKLSRGKLNLILSVNLNGNKNVKYINLRIGVWNNWYFSEALSILSTSIVDPTVPADTINLLNFKFSVFLLEIRTFVLILNYNLYIWFINYYRSYFYSCGNHFTLNLIG